MPRRTPRTRGRPPALTEDVEEAFLDAVTDGIPLTHAARHVGVHPATFCRWMEKGEQADQAATAGQPISAREQLYRDFRERTIQARGRAMVRNVGVVEKAAQGGYVRKRRSRKYTDDDGKVITETETDYADVDWRAAKWLLEVSFPRDFAPGAQRLEVSGPDGSPVQVEHTVEIAALAERLHAIAHRDDAELEAGGDVVDAEVLGEG